MQQTKLKSAYNLIGIGILFYISVLTFVGTFSILFRNLLLVFSNHPILNAILVELVSISLMALSTILFKNQLRKIDLSSFHFVKKTLLIFGLIWMICNLIQAFVLPELIMQLVHIASQKNNTATIDEFTSAFINLLGNIVGIIVLVALFFGFKSSEALKREEINE